MKLIVGLGNPGSQYAGNRHNTGFMCISHFARRSGIAWNEKQGKARIGLGVVRGIKLVVARPQTYMNSSGESVRLLFNRHCEQPDDLIVIHDDLDLPVGKIRIRLDGGSGGHKGIESIVASLGSPDFVRVRVGIGRPAEVDEDDIISYVLSNFTPEEKQLISEVIPRVSDALVCLLTEGLIAAMNGFN